MASPLVLRSGSTSVEMSSDLREFCAEMLDEIAPGIVQRLDSTCEGLIGDAQESWPVDTGTSKEGLVSEIRVGTDAVEGVILDRAAYTYKIRFAKMTPQQLEAAKAAAAGNPRVLAWLEKRPTAPAELAGKAVWNTLVRDPGTARGDRLADELQGDLERLAERAGKE